MVMSIACVYLAIQEIDVCLCKRVLWVLYG